MNPWPTLSGKTVSRKCMMHAFWPYAFSGNINYCTTNVRNGSHNTIAGLKPLIHHFSEEERVTPGGCMDELVIPGCYVEELKASMPISGTEEGTLVSEGDVSNHSPKESHEGYKILGSLWGDCLSVTYETIKLKTLLNLTCITFLLLMCTMFDLLGLLPLFLISAFVFQKTWSLLWSLMSVLTELPDFLDACYPSSPYWYCLICKATFRCTIHRGSQMFNTYSSRPKCNRMNSHEDLDPFRFNIQCSFALAIFYIMGIINTSLNHCTCSSTCQGKNCK